MKNNYPFISIITPSLNQGKFIEKTIQSVLNQNYPNFEHIIIDGGSTDETIGIIKKYPHLIWKSGKDGGQSEAINKGFRMAKGEIIAWINSDDFYSDEIFFKIAELFLDPNIMWIYGNTFFIDELENIISYKKPTEFNFFVLLFGSFSISQPAVFLRRNILKKVGYLREDFHAMMDKEWYCRISKSYKPHYINCDIAYFRWHPSSKSSSPKNSLHVAKEKREKLIVVKNYAPVLSKLYSFTPRFWDIVFNNISRIIKTIFRIKKKLKNWY